MKIQLILPKSETSSDICIRGWLPPLGLMSIGSYILGRDDTIGIEIIDGSILDQESIEKRLNADIVGISTVYRNYSNALSIATKAKAMGSKVVLGGPYATYLFKEILTNRPFVDAIVRYDGEEAFYKYIKGVQKDKIDNLAYIESKNVKVNKIKFVNVNNLPFINRGLIYYKPYFENFKFNTNSFFNKPITIYSQRGCFWRANDSGGCNFCAIQYPQWRPRNPLGIWKELETAKAEYGFDFVFDVSDDIAGSKNWFHHFVKTKPKDLGLFFRFYICANNISELVAKDLLKVGCCQLFVGFESMDDCRLKDTNKGAKVIDNLKAIKILNKIGINYVASFIFGLLGETKESIDRTINVTLKLQKNKYCEDIHWSVIKPIPGNQVFELLKNHPSLKNKYVNKDIFDLEEMRKDWIKYFCKIDYDYITEVNKILNGNHESKEAYYFPRGDGGRP